MNSRASSYFFFVLLLGAAVAAVLIFLPFLTPLVLAAAATVISYPLFKIIRRTFGEGSFVRTMAASLTVLIVAVLILVPLFFLVGSIYAEIQTLYAMLTDEGNRSTVISDLNSFSQSLSNMVFGAIQPKSFDSLNVTNYIKGALQWAFANLDTIFSGFAVIAGYLLVFLLATFYFLRDGAKLIAKVVSWSPLLADNESYIVSTLKRAIKSVFIGSLAVSAIEGIATGLGFWVFGIPAPALWGTVAAVASLVPGLGVSLVLLPAAGYLILGGNYAYAAGLLIWGYTVVILVDHTLGPILINRGVHLHPFLVLLSVLGGLLMFGVVGFVMGPLVLVFLFTLLDIYQKSVNKSQDISKQ